MKIRNVPYSEVSSPSDTKQKELGKNNERHVLLRQTHKWPVKGEVDNAS